MRANKAGNFANRRLRYRRLVVVVVVVVVMVVIVDGPGQLMEFSAKNLFAVSVPR